MRFSSFPEWKTTSAGPAGSSTHPVLWKPWQAVRGEAAATGAQLPKNYVSNHAAKVESLKGLLVP